MTKHSTYQLTPEQVAFDRAMLAFERSLVPWLVPKENYAPLEALFVANLSLELWGDTEALSESQYEENATA